MSIHYTFETLTKRALEVIGSEEPYSQEDIHDITWVILLTAREEVNFTLAEESCEKFIQSTDATLKMIAIQSVGHIARVYHRKVNSNIMEEIYRIYKDSTHKHWGMADDTLDELEFFLKISKPK